MYTPFQLTDKVIDMGKKKNSQRVMKVQAVAPHSLKDEMSFASSGLPETMKGHDYEEQYDRKSVLKFCCVSSDAQLSGIHAGFDLSLMITELEHCAKYIITSKTSLIFI